MQQQQARFEQVLAQAQKVHQLRPDPPEPPPAPEPEATSEDLARVEAAKQEFMRKLKGAPGAPPEAPPYVAPPPGVDEQRVYAIARSVALTLIQEHLSSGVSHTTHASTLPGPGVTPPPARPFPGYTPQPGFVPWGQYPWRR